MTATTTSTKEEIYYPDTDGEPMAETDFQRDYLVYAVEALKAHFQEQDDVYVSGNLLIYYEEGNPRASIAPDVFVVFGILKAQRRIYKVWEEGKGPDVVIEITSETTRVKDETIKPALYRQLGVKEYFQYDPTGDYLQPALKGSWLDEDGGYQAIEIRELPGGSLSLESRVLGLELHLEEGRLRLFDPAKTEYLLSYAEAEKARLAEREARLAEQKARYQAEEQTKAEVQARQEAEARAKELEAELARLRAKFDKEA